MVIQNTMCTREGNSNFFEIKFKFATHIDSKIIIIIIYIFHKQKFNVRSYSWVTI